MYHTTTDIARVLPLTMMIADHYLSKTFCFRQNVNLVDGNTHVGFMWDEVDDENIILTYYVSKMIDGELQNVFNEQVFSYNLKERKGEELYILFSYDLYKMYKTGLSKENKKNEEELNRSIEENKDKRIICEMIEKYVKSTTRVIIENLH
jgi:hypothetical protein